MRKSRIKTSESRSRIVANASRLFLTKGLASVSTRDVMSSSGMAQGGFYKHFGAKEELIAVAHQTAVDHLLAMLDRAIANSPPKEALKKIVDMYLGQSPTASEIDLCPLAMIGAELKHSDDHHREIALLGYQRFVDLIQLQLERLGRPGANLIAIGMCSALVGAVTLASISISPAQARRILSESGTYVLRDVG